MLVDPNHHVPIYAQIIDLICGAIAAGVYRPGETLPSIRSLALGMVVNPNTVQRAYQELERTGLIRTRKGLGMFVADNGIDIARRRSESTVQTIFDHGVDVGRQANLTRHDMESIFNRALTRRLDSAAPSALEPDVSSSAQEDQS